MSDCFWLKARQFTNDLIILIWKKNKAPVGRITRCGCIIHRSRTKKRKTHVWWWVRTLYLTFAVLIYLAGCAAARSATKPWAQVYGPSAEGNVCLKNPWKSAVRWFHRLVKCFWWWMACLGHNICSFGHVGICFFWHQECLKPKLIHIAKPSFNLLRNKQWRNNLASFFRFSLASIALSSPLYAASPAAAQMQTCISIGGIHSSFTSTHGDPLISLHLLFGGNLKRPLLCACASVVHVCVWEHRSNEAGMWHFFFCRGALQLYLRFLPCNMWAVIAPLLSA